MTSPSTSAAAAAAAAVPPALQITDRDFPTPAFISEGYEPKHPMKVSDIISTYNIFDNIRLYSLAYIRSVDLFLV